MNNALRNRNVEIFVDVDICSVLYNTLHVFSYDCAKLAITKTIGDCAHKMVVLCASVILCKECIALYISDTSWVEIDYGSSRGLGTAILLENVAPQ